MMAAQSKVSKEIIIVVVVLHEKKAMIMICLGLEASIS